MFHVPSILFRIICHDLHLLFQSPLIYLLSDLHSTLSVSQSSMHYSSTYLPKHFNHYIIFWSLSSLLVTPQRCYSWKHVEYYVAERKEHPSLCHLTAWMTWTPICAFTRKQNRTTHWLQLLHGCRVLQCSLLTALINTQIFAYVPNKQN